MDIYSPKEIAQRAENVGVTKSKHPCLTTFILAVLAGAFIAMGACLYTTVITESSIGFGLTKLIGGISFSVGLILVIIAGAELFTGNILIVVATLSGKVRFTRLIHNWIIVYLGNFTGALLIAGMIYLTRQWTNHESAVGVTAYNIAAAKLKLTFCTAFFAGIMCNVFVCLAVWLSYGARTATDKIMAVMLPVAAFVTLGFEHSVANMYFIPYAMMLAKTGSFVNNPAVAGALKIKPEGINMHAFLIGNLVPVTLGNIVGGALFVGGVYWFIFLRGQDQQSDLDSKSEERQLQDVLKG